jgi:membrane fusion protein (multidrug efflux system)
MADADPKIDPKAATDTVVISPPPGTLTETPVKRRTWLRPLLMVSLPLLIIAIAGYFWLTAGRFVSTDNAYIQQDKVSVSSDVGGRIVRVDARENQPVKAGDLLFQIDPDPYRIALAQANAAIATARVQVSTLATDSGGAAADISSAKADIALAQATYDRQAALMKQGFTTRASFDAAAQQVAAA